MRKIRHHYTKKRKEKIYTSIIIVLDKIISTLFEEKKIGMTWMGTVHHYLINFKPFFLFFFLKKTTTKISVFYHVCNYQFSLLLQYTPKNAEHILFNFSVKNSNIIVKNHQILSLYTTCMAQLTKPGNMYMDSKLANELAAPRKFFEEKHEIQSIYNYDCVGRIYTSSATCTRGYGKTNYNYSMDIESMLT